MRVGHDHNVAGGVGEAIQNDEAFLGTVNDQCLFVAIALEGVAEDAVWLLALRRLLQVLVAPGRPEVVHFVPASGGSRSPLGVRRIARRLRSSRLGTVDEVLEFLAGFEEGNLLGRHLDLFAGLGVPSHAPAALSGAETAEAADFDLVAFLESIDNTLKNSFHDGLRFLARKLRNTEDLLD